MVNFTGKACFLHAQVDHPFKENLLFSIDLLWLQSFSGSEKKTFSFLKGLLRVGAFLLLEDWPDTLTP